MLITDLGLMVKTNADATHDVFVHSIATGQPVAGASVELLGKNGAAVLRRSTAPDGHVTLPATRGFEREKTPTVFLVRNGRDAVFLPFARNARRLQYSRFDVGGQYLSPSDAADRLSALVFTDRGLYRPGDTAQLGVVVKRRDWRALGDLPLLLTVVDPRGQTALERRLRLPAGGLFDAEFATAPQSPTGSYSATVFLLDERGRRRALGSDRFRVEEFQPDSLRIRATLTGEEPADAQRGWLKPDRLAVAVALNNLFGTPAEARRVSGRLRLTPAAVRIPGFEDFTFDDPLRQSASAVRPVELDLAAATTDAGGRATLPLPLDRYEAGIYRVVATVEGFEAG
ncbi:MAG: MG2 domain-containing protein, partial [Pseudomonadota bacterium]